MFTVHSVSQRPNLNNMLRHLRRPKYNLTQPTIISWSRRCIDASVETYNSQFCRGWLYWPSACMQCYCAGRLKMHFAGLWTNYSGSPMQR